MKAMYPGTCARCGHRIAQGEHIAPYRDGYQHAACASGGDE